MGEVVLNGCHRYVYTPAEMGEVALNGCLSRISHKFNVVKTLTGISPVPSLICRV